MGIFEERYMRLLIAVFTAVMFGLSPVSEASDVSVFQHALEYERPELYEVRIHYFGELSGEEQVLFDKLEAAAHGEGRRANISVKRLDHAAKEPVNLNEKETLPRLELLYPPGFGIRTPFWEGPLEEGVVEQILHSPVRQRIADKLIDRRVAVWVLLESGNEIEDERALEFLEETLSELERTLEVPEPEGVGEIYSDIEFSILVVDREDPEEEMLVNMLLGSERDLAEYGDRPIVFPVYGRGAFMYALIGEGINNWTLNSAAEYLTGSCSECRIGTQEVNLHLLTFEDWDGRVEQLSHYDNAERRYGTYD